MSKGTREVVKENPHTPRVAWALLAFTDEKAGPGARGVRASVLRQCKPNMLDDLVLRTGYSASEVRAAIEALGVVFANDGGTMSFNREKMEKFAALYTAEHDPSPSSP